jgi:hypothetical protein
MIKLVGTGSRLYRKNGYKSMLNYGHTVGVENNNCFKKSCKWKGN